MNFVIKLVKRAKITPINVPPIDTTKNDANARPTLKFNNYEYVVIKNQNKIKRNRVSYPIN